MIVVRVGARRPVSTLRSVLSEIPARSARTARDKPAARRPLHEVCTPGFQSRSLAALGLYDATRQMELSASIGGNRFGLLPLLSWKRITKGRHSPTQRGSLRR